MELNKSSAYFTALSGAATPAGQTPTEDEYPQSELPSQQAAFEYIGLREITRQQWEILKPLIRKVYIEENKPFSYLAQILEKEGFKLTKRQFSRKINEWGFRKNVSCSERRRILQSLPRSMNDTLPDFKDWRLKEGKLRNWRRRYRYEVTVALPPPGQLAMSSNQNLERLYDNQSTQTKSSGSEEALGIPQASETGEDLAGDLGATYGDHTLNEGGGEVPRFDWASVDVIGSPELSRLFRGLEIDCEAFIPMLSLDTFEPEPAAKAYLSGSDILDLFNETNQAIPVRLRQLELVTHSAPKLATQDNQSPQHPWRDIGAVFFGYDPGPFSEVYVFPSSHDAPNRAKNFEKLSLWEDLQAQKIELEAKFAKLETQFRINHPAHIEMSETLAKIYYRLHEGKKAEVMYRKLVELHSQSCGPNSYETLDTMINLIKSLERQGRDLEARSLSLDVRSIISKLCNPWHPISIAATIQYARIVSNLDLFEEAEPLRREVLQIRLVTGGPREKETIIAMSQLGNTLAKRGTKEGETLLRTAVQIISEDPAIKDTVKCQGMERLADAIFYGKEAYEESYNITANAVEQFTVAFGPSHPAILNLQHRLAWSLSEMGKLSESERVFRALISIQRTDGSRFVRSSEWKWPFGLGYVLKRMGNVVEATSWLERAFLARHVAYGALKTVTSGICWELGDCYESQWRFDDALKLYRQLMYNVLQSGEGSMETMERLEWKISCIEEKIQPSASCSPPPEEERSQYDNRRWTGRRKGQRILEQDEQKGSIQGSST